MTTEGWIFMVGLRIFDVGGLIIWLIWFYRLRDDDPGSDDDDPRRDGDPEPEAPPPAGPGGLELPRPDAAPWPQRRRDHEGDRPPATAPARPLRTPEPVPGRRVRQRT